MADLPEYQRSSRIDPGQPVQGFEQAMGAVGAATRSIGEWGSQIAQNASNQMAREKGIEAAQTPGRKLIPAFTQADVEFTKAYKQEEGNVIQYQGNQLLRKLYEDINKNPNPTGQDLLQYENSAKKGIDRLIEMSDAGSKPALKRALSGAYEGYFYDLSNKVTNANRKYMADSLAAQTESTREQLQSAARDGRTDEASYLFEQRIKQIETSASLEGWSSERINLAKQNEKEFYDSGIGQYEYLQKSEEEKPEFIADIRKDPDKHEFLKGLNRVQQDRVIGNLQQFANQYESAFRGQQELNFARYINAINAGTFSQANLEEAQGTLSAVQFERLKAEQIRVARKENKAVELNNFISQNGNNPVEMSSLSDDEADEGFNNKVKIQEQIASSKIGKPYEASLIDKAAVAQEIKRDIPAFRKQLTSAAKFGNAAQASEALRALTMLQNNNPIAVDKVDNDTKGLLYTFGDYIRDTKVNPEEALKAARGDINVDENTKQARLNNWKEKERIQFPTSQSKLNHIAKNLGATKGFAFFKFAAPEQIPSGLDIAYDRIMASTVKTVPDSATAEKIVFEEMKKVITPTRTNNRDELMRFAPENVLEGTGDFQYTDKIRALNDIIENNKQFKKKGEFVYNELSWPEGVDIDSLGEGKDIEIMVDGKKRKVIIQDDLNTQWSEYMSPSWQFNIVDENNVPMPLMDSSTGYIGRWVPDFKGLRNKQLKQRKEFIESQYQKAKGKIEFKERIAPIQQEIYKDIE